MSARSDTTDIYVDVSLLAPQLIDAAREAIALREDIKREQASQLEHMKVHDEQCRVIASLRAQVHAAERVIQMVYLHADTTEPLDEALASYEAQYPRGK